MRRKKISPVFVTGPPGYRSEISYPSLTPGAKLIFRGQENFPKKFILRTVEDVYNFHFTFPKVKPSMRSAFNSLDEVITDFKKEVNVVLYDDERGKWSEGKSISE